MTQLSYVYLAYAIAVGVFSSFSFYLWRRTQRLKKTLERLGL